VGRVDGVLRMRRTALVLTALVVAAAVSGCGGDGGSSASSGSDEDAGPYAASATPPASVAMMDAPADYTAVEGDGFVISVPGEFQQRRETSSNGEPMLVLEKPSQVASVPQRVAVVRDVDPEQAADEQSFALESLKSTANAEAEVQRYEMPAPEGESAYLITWQEVRPGEGTDNVPVTYWQLMHQVDEDLILNVVAYAPADEFETSEVSKILRTFAPSSSA
jgi:hypothetical protein